jgi:hypothetical protein
MLHLQTATIGVINMGRYHFYDESPNVYSVTDKDLGLSTNEPDFDQYGFYYNLEHLQEPPKTDDDTISNMQSPTSQKWRYYLQDTPVQYDEEMSATYSNLIAYATNLVRRSAQPHVHMCPYVISTCYQLLKEYK